MGIHSGGQWLDGCHPGGRGRLRRAHTDRELPLDLEPRHRPHPRGGIAASGESRGAPIAFTDEGCYAEPDWLRKLDLGVPVRKDQFVRHAAFACSIRATPPLQFPGPAPLAPTLRTALSMRTTIQDANIWPSAARRWTDRPVRPSIRRRRGLCRPRIWTPYGPSRSNGW